MNLFGMHDEDFARDIFQTIDENRDGLISKEESLKKYQTLRTDNGLIVNGFNCPEF